MRCVPVVMIGVTVLAGVASGQPVRDDAKKYIAQEWLNHPDICLTALKLLIKERDKVGALAALKSGVAAMSESAHIRDVYDQASKFPYPSPATDSLWQMVVKSAPSDVAEKNAGTPKPSPDEEADLACDASYKELEELYDSCLPALETVRRLYRQGLYLDAIYGLLNATPPGVKDYATTLANYRLCYAVKPDPNGKYRLFEYLQKILGD